MLLLLRSIRSSMSLSLTRRLFIAAATTTTNTTAAVHHLYHPPLPCGTAAANKGVCLGWSAAEARGFGYCSQQQGGGGVRLQQRKGRGVCFAAVHEKGYSVRFVAATAAPWQCRLVVV
nr:hypothetical protein [Tanacetum cinerariifolium]